VEGPSGKLYAGRSLWGMLPAQEPRRSAIRLAELLVERPRLSEPHGRAACLQRRRPLHHTPQGSLSGQGASGLGLG
jgi:hypothetical protein